MMCFNHLSEAHTHMSSFTANMSSLAKITGPKTFDMAHEGSSSTDDSDQHPRALPESGPRSTPGDHHLKNACPGWKKSSFPPSPCLSRQEPRYGPTRLLAAAVWLHLKCKFRSMVAPPRRLALHLRCGPNNCAKLLSGKVYLGGSTGATKGKHKWSHTAACEGDVGW